MAYILFVDKEGNERVIRNRYPVFIATIRDSYSQECTNLSKSFTLNEKNLKICIDECFQSAPDSKLAWALGQAVNYYKNQKRPAAKE